MKIAYPEYTFNAAAKTIRLTALEVDLSRLYGIFNITRGVTYFYPVTPALVPTLTAPNIITLNASVDTTGHANGDKLLIIYDTHDHAFDVWRTTFAEARVNSVDPKYWTLLQTGGGQAINQTGGNLVITCGTTTNAETIIRSVRTFKGSLILKGQTVLSQRNANNNCIFELVDLIGDSLAYVINSATSVTVTIPSNPFTSFNVGQAMNIGRISGAAGIPLLATIASVSGNDVTFTVAGWPASGSGTCSLFGWNAIEFRYTAASATTLSMRSRRNGYQTAEDITILTTGTGHLLEANIWSGVRMNVADRLASTLATGISTLRGDRVVNLPDESVEMYAQIRSLNGTSAPTATTWTVGTFGIQDLGIQPVVNIQNELSQRILAEVTGAVTASGTVAATQSGTWTLGTSTNLAMDVGLQYRTTTTGAATPVPITSPSTPAGQSIKGGAGRVIGYHFQNNSAGVRYIKFFNATSVTMGVTSALFEVALNAGQSIAVDLPGGIGFSTGIQVAVTSARGLLDNTAVGLAAGDVTGPVFFS